MAPTSFCCSISSGIYVVTAEAETGCPRPLGRFPRWRPRDACGGSGCNRAVRSGRGGGARAPIRSWHRSAIHRAISGAQVDAGNRWAPGIRRHGCNSAARSWAAKPVGALNSATAGASLPGCASTVASHVSNVHLAAFRIERTVKLPNPGRGTPPKPPVSESGPGGASVAGVGLFPDASVLAACSAPDSALCWPPPGAGR